MLCVLLVNDAVRKRYNNCAVLPGLD